MGYDWGNWWDPTQAAGPLDPAGVFSGTGLASGDTPLGDFGAFMADPANIFGGAYGDETVLQDPQQLAFDEMQRQYDLQQAQQQPFADLGINALGNIGNYQQSPEFDTMLQQGAQTIDQGAAAGGMYDSSATGNRMAGFVNQLTSDDVQRQYQQNLNAIMIGQGGAGAIGGAMGNMGQQQGNINNLQQQLLQQQQQNNLNNQGQMWGNASQFGTGLGNWLGNMGGGGGGSDNPWVTSDNPLGLTPGQGL